MPRTLLLIALIGLAMSTGAAAAAPPDAASSGASSPAAPGRDPVRLEQSVQRRTTEVTQLQRDVAAQERRSHEAAERLREQDRVLEQLRRQLRSTQGAGEVAQNQGQ